LYFSLDFSRVLLKGLILINKTFLFLQNFFKKESGEDGFPVLLTFSKVLK